MENAYVLLKMWLYCNEKVTRK